MDNFQRQGMVVRWGLLSGDEGIILLRYALFTTNPPSFTKDFFHNKFPDLLYYLPIPMAGHSDQKQ